MLIWLARGFVFRRGSFPTFAQRDFRGLALVSAAFLGLLLFQLAPLPPRVIKAISPGTYRLYRQTLPGWPQRMVYANPAYANPPGIPKTSPAVVVLPTVDEVRGGAEIPFAPPPSRKELAAILPSSKLPAEKTADVVLDTGSWRPLSVMPLLTRAGLLKCGAYLALFFVVAFYRPGAGEGAAERRFRRVMVLMVLASGVAVAMLGVSQQASWFGDLLSIYVPPGWGPGGAHRASGPFINPDHFANYLAMVLPLALAGALFRVPLEPAPRFSGFQFLCVAAALILVAGIVISLSRAGWIEIGLAIVAFAYLLETRRRHHAGNVAARAGAADDDEVPAGARIGGWFLPLGVGLTVVALAAFLLLGPAEREQAGSRVDESVSSGVGFWDRVDVWADSAKIVRDYPAFGAGMDSWSVTFLHYQRPPWTPFFNSVAQNDYVEAAAEIGLIGLFLLGWLCWKVGRNLYHDSFAIPSRHWPLFAALIPAIVVMGFHETLDFPMQIPANAVLFVTLVALAMRLARTYGGAPIGRPSGAIARTIVPVAFGAAAIAGLLALSHQREVVYPDDVPMPASARQVEATILAHPASPLPHLWLARMVHDASGKWLAPELDAAVWLDPTNPAGRDRHVQSLLAAGKQSEAIGEMTYAAYLAPNLDYHRYLNQRLIPWLTKDERAAVESGLRQAVADGYEGSTASLAQLYGVEGRQLDAAALYEQAASAEQDPSLKYNDYMKAGDGYAAAGKKDQAERVWLAAMSLAPDQPQAYDDLINVIYGPQKKLAAADRLIQTASANGLDPAPMYLALAAAAEMAGDHKAAETALGESIHYDPSYTNLIRVATFYVANGKYARATELLHRALEINPNSGEAYFYLAQAEEGAYQYSEARNDYQRAIALAPDHPEYKTSSKALQQKIAQDSARSNGAPVNPGDGP